MDVSGAGFGVGSSGLTLQLAGSRARDMATAVLGTELLAPTWNHEQRWEGRTAAQRPGQHMETGSFGHGGGHWGCLD